MQRNITTHLCSQDDCRFVYRPFVSANCRPYWNFVMQELFWVEEGAPINTQNTTSSRSWLMTAWCWQRYAIFLALLKIWLLLVNNSCTGKSAAWGLITSEIENSNERGEAACLLEERVATPESLTQTSRSKWYLRGYILWYHSYFMMQVAWYTG